MNTNGPLYGAIRGLQLEVDEFHFGYGITIRKTYAHVMAPLMMAFNRPERGKPHPAPWKPVGGGIAIDIEAEIEVPSGYQPSNGVDRPNTIWLLCCLIRLRTLPCVSLPLIADTSLKAVGKSSDPIDVQSVEAMSGRSQEASCRITMTGLLWIQKHWEKTGALFSRDGDFSMALQAFDFSSIAGTPSLTLLSLWGALEQLFAPARQELRFRVPANISAFLEPAGKTRFDLHRSLVKLYDARSKAAHSAQISEGKPAFESHQLLKRVLVQIIENGKVPSREELERNLFGA